VAHAEPQEPAGVGIVADDEAAPSNANATPDFSRRRRNSFGRPQVGTLSCGGSSQDNPPRLVLAPGMSVIESLLLLMSWRGGNKLTVTR
jgi:hypothetical protein